jgi:uncharacterized RDD family membrane protein YckC
VPLFSGIAHRLEGNVVRYFAAESLLGSGPSQELIAATLIASGIALSVALLAWFFGTALFFALCESFAGASPGKYALGLRVQPVGAPDGDKPSVLRAFLRQTAKPLSYAFFGLGLLMVFWTEQQQTLHDKIARCRVVLAAKQPGFAAAVLRCAVIVLLSVAAAPKLSTEIQTAAAPIRAAIRSYRSPGLVERMAWSMVRQGLRRLPEPGNSRQGTPQ